jgi:hypothetical protein
MMIFWSIGCNVVMIALGRILQKFGNTDEISKPTTTMLNALLDVYTKCHKRKLDQQGRGNVSIAQRWKGMHHVRRHILLDINQRLDTIVGQGLPTLSVRSRERNGPAL